MLSGPVSLRGDAEYVAALPDAGNTEVPSAGQGVEPALDAAAEFARGPMGNE